MSNTDPLSLAPDSLMRGGLQSNGKTSLNTSGAVDHLAAASWTGQLGQATTVTYAYRLTGTVPDDQSSGFGRFTPVQIAGAEKAMVAWADVANIRFTRVDDGSGYSDNATILFADYGDGPDAGFAHYPGSRTASSVSGDVWINDSLDYNQVPVIGDYGGQVFVHEIGHALGMSHPGDYNGSEDGDPDYTTDAEYYEDSRQYTVMSYFPSSNTGASLGAFSGAPLIDDIAAIQALYGANMTTRAGDTVYGFHSTAGREWYSLTNSLSVPLFSVWDGGGNDTLDFSGFGNAQRIDLRAGDFSDVGGWAHNVSIANGVTIENAIGGSGIDTIIGNATGNVLDGGTGNDTLYGEGGNDTLRGGTGDDSLDGGSGSDQLDGGDGNDRLLGSPGVGPAGSASEADYFFGGSGADTVVGGVGNEHIYGNNISTAAGAADGGDNLSGGEGNDYIQGNGGADTIDGGSGNDRLFGGADNDNINGGGGYDYLQGNKGSDTLSGGANDDVVRGGADNDALAGDDGNDTLSGDAGDDRLSGGKGLDQLTGGDGADAFLFAAGDAAPSGNVCDKIFDFGNGADRIILPFHVVEVLHGASATVSEAFATGASLLAARSGAADIAAISVGSDTYLFFDGDGAGGAMDSVIDLIGTSTAAVSTAFFAM